MSPHNARKVSSAMRSITSRYLIAANNFTIMEYVYNKFVGIIESYASRLEINRPSNRIECVPVIGVGASRAHLPYTRDYLTLSIYMWFNQGRYCGKLMSKSTQSFS